MSGGSGGPGRASAGGGTGHSGAERGPHGRPDRERTARARAPQDARVLGKPARTGPSTADFALAALTAIASTALFVRTACPTIHSGDSAELAAAAALFGVPHPPGYPLYTLATGALVRVLPVADLGHAANLASAVWAALAVAALVLVLRCLGVGRAASAAAAAVLATGATFWSQATAAEVYTFDVLLALLAALALLRAAERDVRGSWVLAGLAAGLWIGHRPVNLLLVLGPLVALLMLRERRAIGPRLVPAAAAALASAAVYLYLPLASLRDPAIDIGDPETWERFRTVVGLEPYRRHLGDDLGRHAGRLGRFLAALPRELGLGVLLAPLGAVALARRGQRALLAAALIWIATNAGFASRYEVLDVDVFYLPSILMLAVLAGFGADALLGATVRAGPPLCAAASATLVAVTALLGLTWNFAARDLSQSRWARLAAEDLLESVEPDGLVFVNGDTTIHALWFLQGVEGLRPDVVVVSLGHATGWYAGQLAEHWPQEPWPVWRDGLAPGDWGRAVLDSLGRERPASHGLSVDPSRLVARAPDGRGWGSVPRGLAQRILPAGTELDARELSEWNAAFFDAACARILPVPHEVDMDAKSTLQSYALALTFAAELMMRLDMRAEVRAACERVLALDPDRHESDVRADVRRGLGFEPPRLDLGRQARARLAELDARDRAGR